MRAGRSILLALISASLALPATGLADQEGGVGMPWASFQRLRDLATGRTRVEPAALLSRGEYRARLEAGSFRVEGELTVHCEGEGWHQVPILGEAAGLERVLLDGGAATVFTGEKMHRLAFRGAGRHEVQLTFFVPVMDKGGLLRATLPLAGTATTLLEIQAPEGVEVEVPGAVSLERNNGMVRAALRPTTEAVIEWKGSASPSPESPAGQTLLADSKVHVEAATLVSVSERVVKHYSVLTYHLVNTSRDRFAISLSDCAEILDVQGEALHDWQEVKDEQEGARSYVVYLKYPVKGDYELSLHFECPIEPGASSFTVPELVPHDVQREVGHLGIEVTSNVEVSVKQTDRAIRMDVTQLPEVLWQGTTNPFLLAFRYLEHPWRVVLGLVEHRDLSLAPSTIDQATYTMVLSPNGKLLTRGEFQIRNSLKQFMTLELPEDAKILSAFMAGVPVKPSADKEGRLLLPLRKSQVDTFSVEVVWAIEAGGVGLLGHRSFPLPKVDVFISSFTVDLYLPTTHRFFHFSGVEKGEAAADYAQWESSVYYIGGEVDGRFANNELSVNQPMAGTSSSGDDMGRKGAQLQISQGAYYNPTDNAGILPVKVRIPTRGSLHRFNGFFREEGEPIEVGAFFMHRSFSHLLGLLGLCVGGLLGLWLLSRFRRLLPLSAFPSPFSLLAPLAVMAAVAGAVYLLCAREVVVWMGAALGIAASLAWSRGSAWLRARRGGGE